MVQNQLTSKIVHDGYSGVNSLRFDDVRIMGISGLVTSVEVNGQVVDSWTQNATTKVSNETDDQLI